MTTDTSPAQAVARAFVEARREGSALASYPGDRPETLDQAYAIQAVARELHGGTIAGWKVGRIPHPLSERYGANRLTGPIFADQVVEGGDDSPVMPVFADGFAAAEAEFLLQIASLPEGSGPLTNEEAAAHIGEIRIGIEVASSPYAGINADGPAVTVADFGNNNGLVLGAVIPRDPALLDWPVRLLIDGEEAGAATAATMLDGPFGAARFLFELAAERGLPLAPGQWISTGAVTGVHEVAVGALVEAQFDTDHVVRCKISAA